MNGEGISACDVLRTLPGSNTTSGLKITKQQGNDTVSSDVLQPRNGNKIGHNPLLPRRFVPPKEQSRPSSIFELVHWFNGSIMESKLYKTLYCHLDNEKNPTKLIRSEFREMISMGCSILTYYYDVISGELGFSDDKGKWVRLSYQTLAYKLKTSLIRVKRFFKFLKGRGLVKIVYDQKRDEKGNLKINVSRKYLNPSFFMETLGMKAWKKILRLKEWKMKKSKPKTKEQAENVSIMRNLFCSTQKSIAKVVKKISPAPYGNPEKERQLIKKARLMFDRDPSRSLGDYLKEIKNIPC